MKLTVALATVLAGKRAEKAAKDSYQTAYDVLKKAVLRGWTIPEMEGIKVVPVSANTRESVSAKDVEALADSLLEEGNIRIARQLYSLIKTSETQAGIRVIV